MSPDSYYMPFSKHLTRDSPCDHDAVVGAEVYRRTDKLTVIVSAHLTDAATDDGIAGHTAREHLADSRHVSEGNRALTRKHAVVIRLVSQVYRFDMVHY